MKSYKKVAGDRPPCPPSSTGPETPSISINTKSGASKFVKSMSKLQLQEVLSIHGFVVHGFAVHGFLLSFNSLFLMVQTQSSQIFRVIITKITAEICSLFAHSFLSNHFTALGSDSVGVIMV